MIKKRFVGIEEQKLYQKTIFCDICKKEINDMSYEGGDRHSHFHVIDDIIISESPAATNPNYRQEKVRYFFCDDCFGNLILAKIKEAGYPEEEDSFTEDGDIYTNKFKDALLEGK